jgi:cytidylate kinase
MTAITISRQFGSGGSEVARRVAAALGWRLVDNAFVDGIATALDASPATAEAVDEHVPTLAERIADAFAFGGSEVVPAALGATLPPTEHRVAEITQQVIDQALAQGPAVVVGRGAQSYLAKRADVVHVLCCAPLDALVARTMEQDGLDRATAEATVRARNREREQYVRRHFDRSWLAPEHYDLVINTGTLGIDGAVDLVLDLARGRFGDPGAGSPPPQSSRISG